MGWRLLGRPEVRRGGVYRSGAADVSFAPDVRVSETHNEETWDMHWSKFLDPLVSSYLVVPGHTSTAPRRQEPSGVRHDHGLASSFHIETCCISIAVLPAQCAGRVSSLELDLQLRWGEARPVLLRGLRPG